MEKYRNTYFLHSLSNRETFIFNVSFSATNTSISTMGQNYIFSFCQSIFEGISSKQKYLTQFVLLILGSSIKYVRKIFRKTNIFNPLIPTYVYVYT